MVTTAIGLAAEAQVADFLMREGYKILNKNWRTKVCEIDIVAAKNDVAYFVEVKYRQNASYGDGFAYITPVKLKKMIFASQIWAQAHNWRGDLRLLAAAVDAACKIELIEIEVG